MVELMKSLVFHKVFPQQASEMVSREYHLWINRKGTYQDYIDKVVLVFNKMIRDCRRADVVKVSRKVVDYFKDRQYVFTRNLTAKIRKTHFLLSVSGSPMEVVEEYNKYLKFDEAIGTVFEIKGSRYTGKRILDTAMEKEKVFNDFVAQNNFSLSNSIGVGDTENDVCFLKKVQRPVAFNPNANLEKIARRKKWRIVVERKDVIYKIA
jgi:phosphoserine phosphatase